MLGLSRPLINSISIHLGFWLYLVIGSLIFYFIENPLHPDSSPKKEIIVNETFCQLLIQRVNETIGLGIHYLDKEKISFNWLEIIANECNTLIGIKNDNSTATENEVGWEFSAALFFSMTLLTTIGYGSFVPQSDGGKLFCIFYGFFGIPLCGLLLANTSEYFSSVLLRVYENQRKNKEQENWLSIFTAAALFLLPGLGLFLFIPAVIFSFIEGWTYVDAFYYTFVSLATIGFGDIVPTLHSDHHLVWFYRVSWIGWVFLGIAYWAIIINFITKAFKSKRLKNRWKRTIRLIGQEAHKMGKQLSPSPNKDSFVASKSKTVFDFALQLAGSVGKLDSELKTNTGCMLPGIATALRPTPGKGLMALIQFSAGMLGSRLDPAIEIESNEKSNERLSSDSGNTQRDSVETIYTISGDSGICSEWHGNTEFEDVSLFMPADNPSNSIPGIRKRSSVTFSLPVMFEKYSSRSSSAQWEHLNAPSPPRSRKVSMAERKGMQDLLIDAIAILNEAQTEDCKLDLKES